MARNLFRGTVRTLGLSSVARHSAWALGATPSAAVSLLPASLALAALLAPLSGCDMMREVATKVEELRPEPDPAVPTRRVVGASATSIQTVPATAQSRSAATQRARGEIPTASGGGQPDPSAQSAASQRNDAAASVNAPLAIQSATQKSQPRRSSAATTAKTLAPAGPMATAAAAAAPTEGAVNLSQVSFAPEGGDFSPDIDREGTFLVFASTQHRSTFDLYRKSIDGRTVTQLTNDPSDDLMPAISPDGSMVAFASNRTGNWDVFTMPIGGGAATQITFEADEEVQPTWAPDGKRLAYSRRNGMTGAWEIWVVDTTMPGVRTYLCEGFMPRWSPSDSSDKILFQRARERGSRLYGIWTIDLVQNEGSNPTEVLGARGAALLQPGWSPDGTQIVYTTVQSPDESGEWPERSDLWTIHADGTGRTILIRDQFRNMQPVWGNDNRVYFVSNRNGLENIWALPVGDSKSSPRPDPVARVSSRKAAKPAADASGNAAAADPTPDLLKAEQMAGGVED